uniref:Reverse transcriptase domain-containing protein n=1 Tax=Tanacetum cinerariifolium TaxID=118510 RepID=A0A699HIR6_TANCI|nr:hypothetical protein [Tanacetum cinerariifolium]
MPTTRHTISSKAIEELTAQWVVDALLTYEANQNNKNENGNGNGSHFDGGSASRRTVHTTRCCTYKEFLNCQPSNFKGTAGVNPHVKIVGFDVAYDMLWKDLMKMITELCPMMVPVEEDKVERYIWALPDIIQGNVTLVGQLKNQNRKNAYGNGEAEGRVYTLGGGEAN